MSGLALHQVVDASTRVGSTRSKRDKVAILAELLGQADHQVGIVVSWLCGELPQGRIGVGWSTLAKLRDTPAAEVTGLGVEDCDRAFTFIGEQSGSGSTARREEALRDLLARATQAEQRFLMHLLLGELRQGALAGLMLDGIARAAGVKAPLVRRAAMFSGDVAHTAALALERGAAGLSAVDLRVHRALMPMLAQPADDCADAMASLDTAIVEVKLDGARVQVHRDPSGVRVYTRHLRDVTASVPEVVEAVEGLEVRSIVLDGEALSLRDDGTPLPFQDTMSRFSKTVDIGEARAARPLQPFFFDVLSLDGRTLVDAPLHERLAHLDRVVPPPLRVARQALSDPAAAEQMLAEVLAMGHEGIMIKDPASPYAAGSRGKAWRKIKQAHTLDLVVLAVEWGSGRRKGWLSNLHLGARHGDAFVMLGKTFKGLTDELLAWQTEQLLAREVRRDGHVVVVRPELVVEIAFNEVQRSARYPGGVALRFARVKGYRPDKAPAEADTLDTVLALAPEPG